MDTVKTPDDNRETDARTPAFRRAHPAFRVVAGAILIISGAAMVFAGIASSGTRNAVPTEGHPALEEASLPPASIAKHVPLPDEVRGIYVTASTASSLDRLKGLVAQTAKKGINAIVLDVKTERGSLAFVPEDASLKASAPVKPIIKDLAAAVAAVHDSGLYLIARIPVFEDPDYAAKHPESALKRADGRLWQDAKGLYWLDPAAQSVWKYNAAIAEEVYARGFDEVQFDYIRFATDGKTSQIVYPVYDAGKESYQQTMKRFFRYLDAELRAKGIPISVDVFGLTAWHQSDVGIGQWYPDALEHFDFVSAMVYPSHYAAGTLGYRNPAAHPYEIVLDSMEKGNGAISELKAAVPPARSASQRPWLQAFSIGAVYTPQMLLEQVRASRETGCSGFLFWNASNNYSSLPDLSPKP